MKRLFLSALLVLATAAPSLAFKRADHVFIISFDGGKPSVMQECKMPELKSMCQNGAYSWEAQTVFPSITLTAHTSMLTGVCPEKHHVLWNDWEPEHGMIKTPTIFALAHEKHMSTAMFVGKPKFIHMLVPGTVSHFSLPDYHCKEVAAEAATYIKESKPNLCFIHFADSDGAGHAYGWGSPEQKQSLEDEDAALKTVMNAISDAGIEKSSVVICTADHGGHARTHGSKSPEDMTIPWIIYGDGVKHDFKIPTRVTTCDTAATALWLLDIPLPPDLDGKPVVGAFSESSGLTENPDKSH